MPPSWTNWSSVRLSWESQWGSELIILSFPGHTHVDKSYVTMHQRKIVDHLSYNSPCYTELRTFLQWNHSEVLCILSRDMQYQTTYIYIYMVVSWNRGGTPKSFIFSRIFPYKQSMVGYLHGYGNHHLKNAQILHSASRNVPAFHQCFIQMSARSGSSSNKEVLMTRR